MLLQAFSLARTGPRAENGTLSVLGTASPSAQEFRAQGKELHILFII